MAKLTNALGGAASGAAIGTAFAPGIGTGIGAALGGLTSLFGGDDDDSKIQEQLAKNQELYNNIALPDLQKYLPEDYQYIGDYKPEMAQANTVSEDPSLRQGQLSALTKMAGLADNGLSAVDQAGYQTARDIGNNQAQAGNAAALQSAQARGVGGSGLEFAMHEMANQGGAQMAQQAGLQQAADSARQRALYTQAYGNALGQTRAQDFSNNSANANILNQFNMANTNASNQAQQANLANRQTIGNANTAGHNQAQQYNNQMAQQQFSNQMGKAGGQSGANTGAAQGYAAQGAANQSNWNSTLGLGATVGLGIAGMNQKKNAKTTTAEDET